MNTENVKLTAPHTQVCVWEGTVLAEDQIPDFVAWFMKEFKVRVMFLEQITTLPNRTQDGQEEQGTGGRKDVFFSIHPEDVNKFAVPSKRIGIRWIEDCLSEINIGSNLPIYPERVRDYMSW